MIYLDKRDFAKTKDSFLYYKSDHTCGYELPNLTGELVLSQNKEIIELSRKKGYETKTLSSILNLDDSLGLYEIYSYYFEGKLLSDIDMLEIIFNGLLLDSSYCYCLKIGVTFCWFTVEKKQFRKLGTLQFSEVISKYAVGKFMKRLRFNIAKSGINLNRIKFLVWDKYDMGAEFENYILKYDCLVDFFGRIDGLRGFSCENVMKLLSRDITHKFIPNAERFIDCLNDSFSGLGIYEKDGVLYSRNTYYKDYSSCTSSVFNSSHCDYGIIIDCEGKTGMDGSLNNGLRELGGLIYCRYDNVLLNIDNFYCDEILLEETLLKVLENYREFKKGSSIDVLLYGSADIIMLKSSLNNLKGKFSTRKFLSCFKFYDCRSYIDKYLKDNKITIENKSTLGNIAKSLGVLPIYPKHNPINDARTLFNILAKILQDSESFVI